MKLFKKGFFCVYAKKLPAYDKLYTLEHVSNSISMSTELKRLLATVLFADMAGYSRLMDENEALAIATRQRMESIIRQAIPDHGGEIIQFYGDGVLAFFPNTYDAVQCAAFMQYQMREEPAIPVRMGIHTGEVARDRNNVYGEPVNVASRIESFAVPGAVLFSEKVYDDLHNQPSFKASVMGTFQLKNIQYPVRIFALEGDRLIVPHSGQLQGKGEEKKRSIAVLPFVNMSPDPNNEYFSDGMSEELLNALAKVDTLRVTARTSSFAYKGRNLDIREIGKELGVEAILEGSVRKAGNQVRITTQLIDTADGYHLLSQTYDRKLDDIFAVQDEIAHNITKLLLEKLGTDKVEKKQLVDSPTNNMEAYQLYLKGLFYWSKYNPIAARQALSYFSQATQLDPAFGTAWAAISFCYSFLGGTNQMPASEAFPAAWKASAQALTLNSRLARAHCAQGLVFVFRDWDLAQASAAFTRAKYLAKDDVSFLYSYALFLLISGRFQDAIEILEEAMELDPISYVANTYLIEAYLQSGQYVAALKQIDQAMEMYPEISYLHFLKGWAYLYQEEFEKGLSVLKTKIDPADPAFPEIVASRGYAFAKLGETDRAKACLQRLDELYENNAILQTLADKAIIYFALREVDAGFKLLYQMLHQHLPSLIFMLHSAQWRAVREDPRFPAFREKMGVKE